VTAPGGTAPWSRAFGYRQVDLSTWIGTVHVPSPILTASGTSGHGAELAEYGPVGELGAVVVKSLAAFAWPGNPAPRVHQTALGMVNSVGLEGPGVQAWVREELPALVEAGARVVVSLWGRTVEDFRRAAGMLGEGLSGDRDADRAVVAVEVNVSCPNVEDAASMFAFSARSTAAAVSATACGRPRWAKLSPGVADLTEIAGAALDAGAEALTLVNTLPGMVIDVECRRPALGGGSGGMSGPALHPIAVRAVWECRRAYPTAGIVGVGGVAHGDGAVELLMAGADAVGVGTATFHDPRAPWRVERELVQWCRRHRVDAVRALVGAAQ